MKIPFFKKKLAFPFQILSFPILAVALGMAHTGSKLAAFILVLISIGIWIHNIIFINKVQ
jgi:hypothetical protein